MSTMAELATRVKDKTKRPPKRRGSWMVWDIPPKLKEAFHAKCRRNGTTMKAVLLEFLEAYTRA